MIALPPSRAVQSFYCSLRVLAVAFLVTLALCAADRTSAHTFESAPAEGTVVTRSAASYAAIVAPDSIVAVFGNNLTSPGTALPGFDTDPTTPDVQLPTVLGDATVEINGRSAGLLYVSPGQINCVLPPDLTRGKGTVVVRHASGTVIASGDIEINQEAPSIFTANGSGEGVPAALIYRVTSNGIVTIENPFEFSAAEGKFVSRPLDLGPDGELVFLVLYLTGLSGIDDPQATRLLIGGSEFVPDFVGAAPGFVGLEQINFRLPRHLRGRLKFAVTALGYPTSNICDLEIAPPSAATITITGLNKAEFLAGEVVEVTGTGFTADSEVLIQDGQRSLFNAKLTEATSTSLKAIVPFGAGSGSLIVQNPRGRATFQFKMRTSISGIVQTVERQTDGSDRRSGVSGVTIRVSGQNSVQTNSDGAFLIPDVPAANAVVFEVDGTTVSALSLAKELRQIPCLAGRDNQYSEYIELKATTGASIPVATPGLLPQGSFTATTDAIEQTLPVVFEPMGSTVRLPDGTAISSIKVTVLASGRTPADFPVGHFSSTIVELTPFGAQIAPGGRLTFPNTDGLPAGSAATLFRFDQTSGSGTLGQFVPSGSGQVSADGQQIITAANAIKETSYYFVSIPRTQTTLFGSVVEEDGRPARGALVQARGQSAFAAADQSGAFILANVPVVGTGAVTIEVSLLRPDGTVDRVERAIPGAASGLTSVSPALELPGSRRKFAPIILAPSSLTIEAGKSLDFPFLSYPAVSGATLQPVTVTGASFASILQQASDRYLLHLVPAANAAGNYTLLINSTDSESRSTTKTIALEVKVPSGSVPLANAQTVVTDEDVPVNIILNGSGGSAYRIVTLPVKGTLSGTAPNVVYNPEPNFFGLDSFTYVVGNGTTESGAAVVSIAMRSVNDPPLLDVASNIAANIGEPVSVVINGFDFDAGQKLTLEAAGLPAGATITQVTATSWLLSWTPDVGQFGSHVVSLTLKDDGVPQLSATQMVTLGVDQTWLQTAGPVGGDVRSLVVLGTTIFAGTNGNGIFRSTDQGVTWTQKLIEFHQPDMG